MNKISFLDLPETAFEIISQNLNNIRDIINLEVIILI